MGFGERIKRLRENKGLERSEFADKVGITYHALSKYETNERQPDFDTLQKLADYFRVTTDFLLGREGVPQLRLPILGTIRAGVPILAQQSYDGYIDIPDSIRADFALRVVGDSMIGVGILDGDLALCRESETANSGQIVVGIKQVDTEYSEATLKYYFDNGNGPILRPANPNYPELSGYKVQGIMVALMRQDAPGYQVYQDYLTAPGHEEWTEIIDLAHGAGLKVSQVRQILEGQIEIAKRLRD